jgi:hypothetical protein
MHFGQASIMAIPTLVDPTVQSTGLQVGLAGFLREGQK